MATNPILIFKPFQREVCMIGYLVYEKTTHSVSHNGSSSSTSRNFNVDNKLFSGDYATLRFTAKNCLKFKNISTTYID